MMDSKTAEKIQNEIYRKMPAKKKLKILGELFLFGKKLDSLKYEDRETGRTFVSNRKYSK